MGQVPIAPDIFTWPTDEPQLMGSTCDTCGATTFPAQEFCPRCSGSDMQQRLLPRSGSLVTWTSQEFFPKEPYASGETDETFRPYAIGLVQLGDVVRVESRLTVTDAEELDFGMDLELVIVPFRVDEDGNEVMTFAFAPA